METKQSDLEMKTYITEPSRSLLGHMAQKSHHHARQYLGGCYFSLYSLALDAL